MHVVFGSRRAVFKVACLVPLAMLLVGGPRPAACRTAGGGEPAAVGADQIAVWIAELGSTQFAQREAASRSLAAAGRPALEPLVQAAQNGDLEIATRAVEILREMLDAGDGELSMAAEQILERTAEAGREPTSSLAEATLDFHSVGQAEAARANLEELGAVIADNLDFQPGGLQVELGPAWRGRGEDLRQLIRLRGLVGVRVRGVPLDDQAAAILGRLKTLRRLDLFGTGLSDTAAKLLAEKFPEPGVVDIRKGGKLGVSPQRLGPPCEIKPVAGGAAQRAGMLAGDVVVAVGGEPVADFDGLTARVSGRAPGERVAVDVVRALPTGAAERLRLEVVLDAW